MSYYHITPLPPLTSEEGRDTELYRNMTSCAMFSTTSTMPRLQQGNCTSTDKSAKAILSSKQKKRCAPPLHTVPSVKRRALERLGDMTMNTRDHFGHIVASVKAQMNTDMLKKSFSLNLLADLDALQDTVARDMTAAILKRCSAQYTSDISQPDAAGADAAGADAADAASAVMFDLHNARTRLHCTEEKLADAQSRIRMLEERAMFVASLNATPPDHFSLEELVNDLF